MSMKDSISATAEVMEDDEEWMEKEIQKQLEAIEEDEMGERTDPELENNNNTEETESLQIPDAQEELLPSMLEYMAQMKMQSDKLAAELVECDDLLYQVEITSERRPDSDEAGLLQELADERGVNIYTLKQQMLKQLDDEDEMDKELLQLSEEPAETNPESTSHSQDLEINHTCVPDEIKTLNSSVFATSNDPATISPRLMNGHDHNFDSTERTGDLSPTLTNLDEKVIMNGTSDIPDCDNQLVVAEDSFDHHDEAVEEGMLAIKEMAHEDNNNWPETDMVQELLDKILQETSRNKALKENAEKLENGLGAGDGKACTDEDSKSVADSDVGHGEIHVDSKLQPQEFVLKPGDGVVAMVTPVDELERGFRYQLRELLNRQDARQSELEAKHKERHCKLEQLELSVTAKRQEQSTLLEQQRDEMDKQNKNREFELQKEIGELQLHIQQETEEFEVELAALTTRTKEERRDWEQACSQQATQQQKKLNSMATKIQAYYRGYRARKEHGEEVHMQIQYAKELKQHERIKTIEKQRKEVEDKKRTAEELKKKAEEDKNEKIENQERRNRLEAEEKRKKEAEERRKKDDEENVKAQEKKRLEEEKRREDDKRKEEQKVLEEEKKRLLEIKKKEEEKRLKEQADIKKKEEAERERKQEEERKRKEEERKRKEEERKREEEEDRIKKEEAEKEDRRKKEEMKLAQEAEKEAAKQKREAERLRLEAERKKQQDQAATIDSPRSSSILSQQAVTTQQTPRPPDTPKTGRGGSGVGVRRTGVSTAWPGIEWGDSLPDSVEQRRWAFMKQCLPWSRVEGEEKSRKRAPSKRAPRRPASAKSLPELEEGVLLQAAQVAALSQVTTVPLSGLPGCQPSLLGKCGNLQHLKLTQCGVSALICLQTCKKLKYLDCSSNRVEAIDLNGLEDLVYVDLSNNNLTSIHGLDGCRRLRHLNLSHNRITRIGGMDHLCQLHSLDLSRNQLISTRGIGAVPTVQRLNVSHNHLPGLDDLKRLGLLQQLRAEGNSLMQIPDLANQVLLETLSLSDNSISSVRPLVNVWLPRLTAVHLQSNSLSSIDDLTHLLLLSSFSLEGNQLFDADSVSVGLTNCKNLRSLNLHGNPVIEDSDAKEAVLSRLRYLEKLDGAKLGIHEEGECKKSPFEVMCLSQLQQCSQLEDKYTVNLREVSSMAALCKVHLEFFRRSHEFAKDHRAAHEYGSVSLIPDVSSKSVNDDLDSELLELDDEPVGKSYVSKPEVKLAVKSQARDMKSKFEQALKGNTPQTGNTTDRSESVKESTVTSQITISGNVNSLGVAGNNTNAAMSSRGSSSRLAEAKVTSKGCTVDAKNKFDQVFSQVNGVSGANSKMQSSISSGKSVAMATSVPASKVQEMVEAECRGPLSRLDRAATKIQALWRGHCTRQRLQYAYQYARMDGQADEIDNDLMEFNMDEIDFNMMDNLDADWLPPDTPQLPENHPVLKQLTRDEPETQRVMGLPPKPPPQPQEAWQGYAQPTGRPPLPPLSRLSNVDSDGGTASDAAHTFRSHRSKKEEITEEWGFKDSHTAELMLQRARKMKYNATKRKRLHQLDPKQRLELFRKLEEGTKIRPVHPPSRKTTQRKDYFVAREEEQIEKSQEQHREFTNKVRRTYEWLHSQVGELDRQGSNTETGSQSNLPKMDQFQLGGRMQLTGSPSLDLQSVGDSASMSGTDLAHPRRMSAQSPKVEKLPAIKTSSAPVLRPGEKLSWRKPDVNKSVGWGGGKKRSK